MGSVSSLCALELEEDWSLGFTALEDVLLRGLMALDGVGGA